MAVWTGTTIASLTAAVVVVLGVAGGGVSAAGVPDAALAVAPADAQTGPKSIFGSTKPKSSARQTDTSVELGLRFTTTVDGTINRLRVYRPTGQTGAQTATLWTGSGTRLAGLTLPASSSAGWQSVALRPPVAVTRNTAYVASYHTNDGYAFEPNYFTSGATPGGLVRPAMSGGGLDTHNGVYRYGGSPAFPSQSYRSTNYWIDVTFVGSGTAPTSTNPGPTTTSPIITTVPTTTPTTTPTATATTTSSPPVGVLPANTLPTSPGQVGFRGDPGTLRVINSSATAPSGTTWTNNTLRIDSSGVTLNGVYVKGSVEYYGTGTVTITNSIVQGNGSAWSLVYCSSGSAKVNISDSDVIWPASVASPGSGWGNGAVHGNCDMNLTRNEISGTPDGVQQAGGNSTFTQNYLHNFRVYGSYPNNSHNDGFQLYGGPNTRLAYNNIQLDGYDGTHQNGSIFASDDGGGSPGIEIVGNYLGGGGYQLRLESGTTNAVVTDNIFGPVAGGFGYVTIASGASASVWERNVDSNGNTVAKPR
ncbi:MAG: DUF4082 domain-containing protein [Geodermatophilaceae bacterium]|nr:DUF4082 domain-containing protein [Geodermatophilaceae bacterium]